MAAFVWGRVKLFFPLFKRIGLSRVCLTRTRPLPPRPRWPSRIHLTRHHCFPLQLSRLGLTRLLLGFWRALGIYGCSSPELLFHLGSKFALGQVRRGLILLWSLLLGPASLL